MVINGRKKAHKAQKEFGWSYNYEEHGKPPWRGKSSEFLVMGRSTELRRYGKVDRDTLSLSLVNHTPPGRNGIDDELPSIEAVLAEI